MSGRIIAFFTDFGLEGPYVGQMHAVLAAEAPGAAAIDLFHGAPAFDIRAAAYLLPAYTTCLPEGSVCVAVVDPGVGGARPAVFARAHGRWYVGPDNGLFSILARRAHDWMCREILWRPEGLSTSFHGRDLFVPVAARLAKGEMPQSRATQLWQAGSEWPDDLWRVLYIDRYGNAITGVRAAGLQPDCALRVKGRRLRYARVFAEVTPGEPFWYENSSGLVEIAANGTSAAQLLGMETGDALDAGA
jgi:S-adenosylmethionine hydrolase